jgi:hypothetical protein
MATITLTPEGKVRIVGEVPSAEILEQIKDRIGPEEAAVVVPADELIAFLTGHGLGGTVEEPG